MQLGLLYGLIGLAPTIVHGVRELGLLDLKVNGTTGTLRDPVFGGCPPSRQQHLDAVSKEFQALSGLSVMAYAREQRLQRARRLLTKSEKAIKVIAHEVGYRHDSDFVTAFRKRFGVTPRNYRMRLAE